MAGPLRITSLHVEAFRGVTESLDLDLRSPITLIYAANGTGKTTLCDAAEWLLTGQIERLRDGQHFDDSILVSKFAENREPRVSASLVVADQEWFLERTRFFARMGSSPAAAHPIQASDLLARLAPTASSPDAHHLTAIPLRQNWLRGTRFLSSEALAALVDTDEQTVVRRKQVFADLLGIRHLLDAEDKLRRYSEVLLPEERNLVRQVQEAGQTLQAYRAGLSDPLVVTSSALTEIELAELELGFESSVENVSLRLERTGAELGRRQHEATRKNEAISLLLSSWYEIDELRTQIDRDRELDRVASQKLNDLQYALDQADRSLREITEWSATAEDSRRSLSEARDILVPKLTRLVSASLTRSGLPNITGRPRWARYELHCPKQHGPPPLDKKSGNPFDCSINNT